MLMKTICDIGIGGRAECGEISTLIHRQAA
jgi:hypothetical protein